MNIADYDWCDVRISDCTGSCEIGDDGECDCFHAKIHAPSEGARSEFDDWDGSLVHAKSLCGIGMGLGIPGVFSRMGAERCTECCQLSGLPEGVGSPKNDAECRERLGL